MVEGISPVTNLVQDYTQRPVSLENDFTAVTKGVEPTDKKAEESTPDSQKSAGEFNQDQVRQAVDKMNKTVETYNTELRFQLHEKSGEYMVKIINTKDNSVIREIPPEKILDMVAYFKELVGIVIDKFA
ncbi:flagellar protein FlaG protein [Desulfotomaculum nigrificans CO-1-SRB]|uniref:Flagellar protein FlaG protein n=1 Tax=Desulfotomaculum nigrificans (strain DSM 14880 / VKM B-2319 / CO-1-SRB) TaxID=868595 RepID=F6B815_DESCC|nr:flagellar protein FlaG [Desulfotomaculum nigrificans]AEF94652.1 flagellar protein FlaG protein [Desulfotomaculum nigrificans CO-1-SRB]